MPSVDVGEGGSGSIIRVGSTTLSSLVTKLGNIDVSPSGTIVVLTDDVLYLLLPAVGMSSVLDVDSVLRSHHDHSQDIPLFHYKISIQSCPPDTSKVGSGREAYLISYVPRFLDAKWAPMEVGPHQSPVLAALTTQSQIFIYKAEMNQFKGPWSQVECLTGGDDKYILAMTWMAGNQHQAWLLAGTRDGEVIVWSVEADEVLINSITKLVKGEILGMYWGQSGYLAVVTSEEIQIAQATRTDNSIKFRSHTFQPDPLDGSHVSIARWHNNHLLYCTPGEIHLFDAAKGTTKSVLLQDSGEEDSCCLRPAVSIEHVAGQGWEVLIQDGYQYNISPEDFLGSNDYLSPSGYLPPANEVIGALQRKVEATRGLFAKFDDGTGLTYTCHDGNEISSWSYNRDPKCQFGLSLTRGPTTSRDSAMAADLLDAALKGDLMHFRTFTIFYIYSSKKSEVINLVLQSLRRQVINKDHLQAALRLSKWLQSDQVKEGKETMKTTLHDSILELSLARALKDRFELLFSLLSTDKDTLLSESSNMQYCTSLAKITFALSQKMNDAALADASRQMMEIVGLSPDMTGSSLVETGEKCKACGSNIHFNADSIFLSKCQKGHIWKRCATSLTILDTSSNRTCSICSNETTQPSQTSSELQRQLIQSMTACDLCDGKVYL